MDVRRTSQQQASRSRRAPTKGRLASVQALDLVNSSSASGSEPDEEDKSFTYKQSCSQEIGGGQLTISDPLPLLKGSLFARLQRPVIGYQQVRASHAA